MATTTAELEKILKQRNAWQNVKPSTQSSSAQGLLRRSIRAREIMDFTRQLSTMVAARLPLTRSLEILSKQQKNIRFRQIIDDLLRRVQSGKSLSSSMSHYPKLFDPLYVNMLRIGEISGNMPEILLELADYLEKMGGLKRKLFTAMTYPAVILIVAIGAFSFLVFGVMPTFAEMFRDFGSEIPMVLSVMMNTGRFIQSYLVWLLLLMVAIIYLLRIRLRTEKGRRMLDNFKLRIPLIGRVVKKIIIARFARTLGTLLGNGISLLESLDVTCDISGNRIFQEQILRMKQSAVKGEPMEKSISSSSLFPALLVQMIGIGEETAELPGMLIKTAEYYESEVDAAIEALTSIIEPVIIVVLGVVLGGMMIAIYLQIFDMMNVIQ